MSDEQLRQLLKDKYNTPINGEDCITFHHMQLVINTVRQHDKKQPSPSEVLDEVKDVVLNAYLNLGDTYTSKDMYGDSIEAINKLREKFQ